MSDSRTMSNPFLHEAVSDTSFDDAHETHDIRRQQRIIRNRTTEYVVLMNYDIINSCHGAPGINGGMGSESKHDCVNTSGHNVLLHYALHIQQDAHNTHIGTIMCTLYCTGVRGCALFRRLRLYIQ